MRILMTTDQWFPDLRGGSARVATDTARGLAERGHEVVVIAPRADGQPSLEEQGTLTLRRVLPRSSLPMTLTDPVATWRAVRSLGGEFDVALAHQCTNACGVAAARPGLPLALVVHASPLRELRFDRRFASLAGRARMTALEPLVGFLERRAAASADRIIVLSEFTRSLLAEDRPEVLDRTVRVSGGVDAQAFSPPADRRSLRRRLGVDSDRPLLFSARRLVPRMGLELLFEAFSLVGRGAMLALAGSGPLEPQLVALAQKLGIEDDVRFLGRISDSELADWYGGADLFVLPTVAYEGFGMVTAEALASGLPVVGTPVGATPELLRPLEPRLVSQGVGPDALAAAITAALDDLSDDLRRRCRAYAVEHLAWAAVMGGWEDALLQTAGLTDSGSVRAEGARSPVEGAVP